jgi:hypothetical protein
VTSGVRGCGRRETRTFCLTGRGGGDGVTDEPNRNQQDEAGNGGQPKQDAKDYRANPRPHAVEGSLSRRGRANTMRG